MLIILYCQQSSARENCTFPVQMQVLKNDLLFAVG